MEAMVRTAPGWLGARQVLSRETRTPDGVRLHYEVLGADHPEAPVILLANGLGGRLYAWEPLVERFAPTHRIVTWDYRGLFRSGTPEELAHLAVPYHAADALHILDQEGIERATLVGWSMGVQVSLETALRAPGRVSALVLLNGTCGQAFQTALQPVLRLPRVPWLLHAAVEGLVGRPGLCDTISRLARAELHTRGVSAALKRWWRFGDRRLPEMYAQYVDDVFGPTFPNYLRLFQMLDAHSVYHLLPQVTQPTLVVSGGLDWLTPASMSARIAARIPRAERLHLRLASHFALLEYPTAVLDRLAAFLAGRLLEARAA